MKKSLFALALAFALSPCLGHAADAANSSASPVRDRLQSILDSADLGNSTPHGKNRITTYVVDEFDRDAELAKMQKWKSKACGPWKEIVTRRQAIRVIAKFDEATGNALEAMYGDKQIKSMITLVSNNNIECSIVYIKVFATEGTELDLSYGNGD